MLGYEGELEGNLGIGEEASFVLTESGDATFKSIISDMIEGKSDIKIYTDPSSDEAYYFSYHPADLTGWSVGIAVPEAEVIAPAIAINERIEANTLATSDDIHDKSNSLLMIFFTIMGAIVVFTVPASMFFSRTISNPIKTLDAGSRKIGAGEISHRIEIKSGDEIEDLANTFNQMTNDLEQQINEIETANTELMQLDKLKSQFISMASHELRTPLIAIQGYTSLIREGSAGEIKDEQKEMLKTVSRNTTRLARIVTDLLDLSRIAERRIFLNRQPFSIQQLIEEITAEQKPSLQKRGHVLSLDIQNDIPEINADQDRVAQIIINLIGNSIKYTPDKGRIGIKARSEGKNVHISVSDSGIGIKQKHLSKIFKRFYEVGEVTQHKTGKDEFMAGGTGWGFLSSRVLFRNIKVGCG